MSWYGGLEHIVRESEPLAQYTWFRIGGSAEFFAEPTSVEELSELVRRCRNSELTFRILGAGSRVLVSDKGVQGLVIHLSAPAFGDISVEGDVVSAGGGSKLSHVVSTAVREGLEGLESLVGIPGTVAGALKGNADGNGTSIGQWADEVSVMKRDGAIETIQRADLRFSYRQSNLDQSIVLNAKFKLSFRDTDELTRRMQTLWILKRSNQPMGDAGHGRIFSDAQGMSAATLIEQAGLRNQSVGNAEVSEQNANFIVANPGATSQNVIELIELIEREVEAQLEVKLEREILIW